MCIASCTSSCSATFNPKFGFHHVSLLLVTHTFVRVLQSFLILHSCINHIFIRLCLLCHVSFVPTWILLFLKHSSNVSVQCVVLFFIQMSLKKMLREIVRSCYEHFRQPHLLVESDTEMPATDAPIKIVNNADGSVVFITGDDATILEDGTSAKVPVGFNASISSTTEHCRHYMLQGSHNGHRFLIIVQALLL